MQTKKTAVVASILLCHFLVIPQVFAGAIAHNTAKDQLIEKFNKIYLRLAPKDPAKQGISLRLGDLLSERARQVEMGVRGCASCDMDQDRKRALKYYESVLGKLPNDQKARVLIQVAHLYELLGQTSKAIKTYNKSIAYNVSPEAVSEAHFSSGELYFRSHKFVKALGHYEKVLSMDVKKHHPLSAYRKAWSLFNVGQVDRAVKALIFILETPSLLTRSASSDVVSVDKQYTKEVSKDLGIFLAKQTTAPSLERAKLLAKHTPSSFRVENLANFGHELERLGQNQGAVSVLEYVMEAQESPRDRLNSSIHLASLKRRMLDTENSLKSFEQSLSLWVAVDGDACAEDICKEWKTRLRKYVLDWHHAKKKDSNVLKAYDLYLVTFPKELDMLMWSVQLASQVRDYNRAQVGYRKAQKLVKAKRAVIRDKKFKPLSLESLLLAEVELAEKRKDPKITMEAYDNYLATTEESTRSYDIQYQKAKILYKNEKYVEAFAIYEVLAFLPKGSKGLTDVVRVHSGEFALEALSKQKKDTEIENFALRLAKVAEGKKAQKYLKLAQTSVLNQLVAAGSDTEKAWNTLNRIDVNQAASLDIKKAFYKNKLILAEKRKDYVVAREAADQLLLLPKLSPKDREMALSKKVWFAELMLDFSVALENFKKITAKSLTPEQRILKIALLSELAGKDYRPVYKKYIKMGKDDSKKLAFATHLVKTSKGPVKEIRTYKKYLAKKPEIYATLYLEALLKEGKSLNLHKTYKVLSKTKALKATPEAKFLWRLIFMKKLKAQGAKVASHTLKSNPKKLRRSLTRRVRLLSKTENYLKKAIAQQDWQGQVLSLSLLAKEFQRFYQEIFSLPVPEELTSEEQNQYMLMLSQQAGPYKNQGENYGKKLEELWAQAEVLTTIKKQFLSQPKNMRKLVSAEIEALQSTAPKDKALELSQLLATPPQEKKKTSVSLEEIELAKNLVRKNPLDIEGLKKLLSLEERMERHVASAYLKERITQLEKSQREGQL